MTGLEPVGRALLVLGVVIYIPIATMVVVSILLSVVVSLLGRRP